MEDKIKRFIELSKEFTVESKEIYGKNDVSVYYASSASYCVTRVEENFIEPTRLEQFTKEQEKKVEKAKRFEEYLTLQTDLSNYYKALTKLN